MDDIKHLISVGKDPTSGKMLFAFYENFRDVSAFGAGIMMADIIRQASEVLGCRVDEILEGLDNEISNPTDDPKMMS